MKNFFTNIWVHFVFLFAFAFLVIFKANGYCEAALKLAPEAFEVIEGGSNAFSMTGFNFGALNPIAAPALYDQVNQLLDRQFGYNIDDALTDGWTEINSAENNMNALSNYVMGKNTIDDRLGEAFMSTFGDDIDTLFQNGYRFFSQSVPQFGSNAKSFFIGKIDSATGVISDVYNNTVTKFTSQGLNNFQSVFDSLSDSGNIYNYSEGDMPLCGNTFDFYFVPSIFASDSPKLRAHVVLNKFCILVNNSYLDNGVYRSSYGPKFYYVPDGTDLQCVSCSVVNEYGNLITNDPTKIYFNSQGSSVTVGGVDYKYGNFAYNSYYAESGGLLPISYYFGYNSLSDPIKVELFKSILNSGTYQIPLSITFNYDTSTLSNQLKIQLQRLVDHYIDSASLNRINEILSSISFNPNLNSDFSVAPSSEAVADIESIIDNALAYDPAYQLAFDEYYNAEIESDPDPEPDPEPAPEFPEFPDVIPPDYVPSFINDLFAPDMFSMFKPIFDIVGEQYSMYDTWLMIPTIFVFLFIFYIIISVL